MSKLEFFNRPLVQFDAHNKEHRALYYGFTQKNGWGHSPYRFICPEGSQFDLISMIQRQMMDYYLQREFKDGTVLVSQTRTKTV